MYDYINKIMIIIKYHTSTQDSIVQLKKQAAFETVQEFKENKKKKIDTKKIKQKETL